MAHESEYRDDIPWGPKAHGPAIEAIRQMREEKTAERMRAIAALIARLQGHERTGQEQMGQSPRDQRFWMNEGARRAPTATRGGPSQVPGRMRPRFSPPSFHHEMLGDMESGPEPMYGGSGGVQDDFMRQAQMRKLLDPSMVSLAEANALYRNAPRHPGFGLIEPARRGPPNMALRRRYLGW